MKEPVDHILRPSLPWRQDGQAITECGYDASKVKTISRDDYFARRKELGQQRTALLTCMTCSNTAGRWGTWEDNPLQALQREIEWETGNRYAGNRGDRLRDELAAIEMLIERHQDEFKDIISVNEQRREWNERKAEMKGKSSAVTETRPRQL